MTNTNYTPRGAARRAYDRKREASHARFRIYGFLALLAVFIAGWAAGAWRTEERAKAQFDSVNCVERVK